MLAPGGRFLLAHCNSSARPWLLSLPFVRTRDKASRMPTTYTITASIPELSDDTLMVAFLHHGIYTYFMYDHQRETYGYPYQSATIHLRHGYFFDGVLLESCAIPQAFMA